MFTPLERLELLGTHQLSLLTARASRPDASLAEVILQGAWPALLRQDDLMGGHQVEQ